jgi:hypothetical protein
VDLMQQRVGDSLLSGNLGEAESAWEGYVIEIADGPKMTFGGYV